MSSSRLEAFSDGVFAIIITIMVLDLRAPASGDPAALLALWPTFAAYALSFFVIAIYWLNHHRTFHIVKRVGTAVLWANLFFLFCLSLVPFATAYLGGQRESPSSVALYAAWMFVCCLAAVLMRCAMILETPAENVTAKAMSHAGARKNGITLIIYAVAVPTAYVSTRLSLALICASAAVYVLPGFAMRGGER